MKTDLRKQKKGQERRKNRRQKTRRLVRAELAGRQHTLGDLSINGAFIRTSDRIAVGESLEFRLVGERLEEPIEVSGVVRRRDPGIGVGVEFLRFPKHDLSALEPLLAGLAVARILVVDDDPGVQRVLQLALEREKYEVHAALDGTEGLQKALELRPDLIILDLKLPGLSGIEVCQKLRETPSVTHIPILILSATADLTEIASVQTLGAVVFAPKPFHAQRLLVQIRMLLER